MAGRSHKLMVGAESSDDIEAATKQFDLALLLSGRLPLCQASTGNSAHSEATAEFIRRIIMPR